ncbi:MAG: phosphoribosylamine--glycine ligase [Rickettsiales bacterium]|nr:phosphoribosylamine--glycine ligase [Rickettsiales bacterium]
MKILIIGSGGREHSITISLNKSDLVKDIYVAPGNAGTALSAQNIPIKETDIELLANFAEEKAIDLTFVGPEAPLVLGIVDYFEKRNLKIIGPDKKAAQLEGSKNWAKELMKKYKIPTAEFKRFTDYNDAFEYLKIKNTYPIVIKADGLAAGKGVTVAQSENEAILALKDCFINEKFKEAGKSIIIEDFLSGQEASIFAFTDGKTILPMEPAQDHKAIYDGDKGPNTGGMGAYCPAPLVTPAIQNKVYKTVFEPLLKAIKEENLNYTGIIYAGLMIDQNEIVNIVEFNVRFGDPETQVVLPRLKTDLATIFKHIVEKSLDKIKLEWDKSSTVGVVLASGGYPESYEKNKQIQGLDKINNDCHVVHAGTKLENNILLTNGGRVLCIVGKDKELKSAIDKTYQELTKIKFDKVYFRNDIGQKGLK